MVFCFLKKKNQFFDLLFVYVNRSLCFMKFYLKFGNFRSACYYFIQFGDDFSDLGCSFILESEIYIHLQFTVQIPLVDNSSGIDHLMPGCGSFNFQDWEAWSR